MGDAPTLAIVGAQGTTANVKTGAAQQGWRLSTSNLPQGIAILTRTSQFLEVNETFAQMVGVDPAVLTNGVHPVGKTETPMLKRLQLDFKAIATAGVGHYEISIHRSNGKIFPAEVRVMPLEHDDPNKPEALLCSVTDRSVEEAEVERLTRGEIRATMALNSFPESIAILDANGTILATNQAWDRFAVANGGANAHIGIGENYLKVCDESSATCSEAVLAGHGIRRVIAGEIDEFNVAYPCSGPDIERWCELFVSRFREFGETRVVVCHEDITARHQATDKLAMQAQLMAAVNAAVVASDLDGKIVHWSPGATELLGHQESDAIGAKLKDLVAGFPGPISATANDAPPAPRETEAALKLADGTEFVAAISESVFRDHAGSIAGTLAIITDVSERAERVSKLTTAYEYMLTVSQSIGDGLLTLDNDGCVLNMNPSAERLLGWTEAELAGKPIKDAIGYEMQISEENGVWATRVDDDFFTTRDGRQIPVAHTTSPFETSGGINGAVVTFNDITSQKLEHQRLEREIEDAIWAERINKSFALDRFELYVQPIFEVESGEQVQNELLIRMLDDDGSIISPAAFLPAAERQGLIQEIDRWVIRRAANLASENHPVELNLSAGSLSDPELADYIIDEMEAAGADPANVIVELTETAIVENEATAEDILRTLRINGFRIALDDFGTGYGSFTYLKNLPVDFLKIDIEFVKDLPSSESSRNLVAVVVQLAENFGLKTVAEGVEDMETVELLKQLGVDHMQGFALGRPEPYFLDEPVEED